MNKKGFTLVELLATLIVLALVMTITFGSISGIIKSGKEKSEVAFVKTLEDAINVYIDIDGRKKNYNSEVCKINKTHKQGVSIKKADNITFSDIINTKYKPIVKSDMINPANKTQCLTSANISLYQDDDYVYYYMFDSNNLKCLDTYNENVTTLPCDCLKQMVNNNSNNSNNSNIKLPSRCE